MSEESKSGWPIEDISELTRQLKNEERRPIIGWFSIDNQDSVFATDAAPQRVPDICGIAFCMRGSADIAIDGRRFHITSGDMCAIFPNTLMQTFERSSDFECRVLVVDASIRRAISVSAAMKIFLYIHEHPCTSLNPEEAEALRGYMQSLYMLHKRPDHIYREEIAERLIIAFCYEVAAIYHRGNAFEKEERTRQEYIFYEFMELLAEHYTTERQV
ncbi:MAG: AraC family ligand binding domain-containing protein, partial [Alistipes sp.]|nr:AraC family ligand binding domain-containing protein [Alistipes sp.]